MWCGLSPVSSSVAVYDEDEGEGELDEEEGEVVVAVCSSSSSPQLRLVCWQRCSQPPSPAWGSPVPTPSVPPALNPVVQAGLERAVAVCIHKGKHLEVGDRNIGRRDAHGDLWGVEELDVEGPRVAADPIRVDYIDGEMDKDNIYAGKYEELDNGKNRDLYQGGFLVCHENLCTRRLRLLSISVPVRPLGYCGSLCNWPLVQVAAA
ncbi:hypothetical protein B0H14DRAFT_2623927 [Mycena olivaceomarginata]|nr:hypothetical protein B0H14DRAFT_2623927 [Mycena olivaceomarginata]